MERDQIIRLLSGQQQALDDLGVESLSLFGSVVRGENHPQSDIDVLVDFRGIDVDILWDIVEHQVPALLIKVQHILAQKR